MRHAILALVPVVVAAVAVWTATLPASAALPEPELGVAVVREVQSGLKVEIVATLLDPARNPIEGQEITFEMDVAFLNNFDNVVIGTAETGGDGRAYIEFTPRAQGDHALTASFAGTSVFAQATASVDFSVLQGAQLYQELSPVRVPGANVWMAAAVLVVVWTIFLITLYRIWRIARLGEDAVEGAHD